MKKRFSWVPYLISVEVRRLLSYRVDFWVQFLGGLCAELGIAYFLWSSIFAYQGLTQVGGYSFHSLMLYYAMVPLVDRLIRGPEWSGFISKEIYEGTLTRYLIYPVSFLVYKYVTLIAFAFICVIQLLLAIGAFFLIFGLPSQLQMSASSIALGILTTCLITYLYFSLSSILEMIAFWAEGVWSLLVMLRFCVYLLGGGLIPLSLFPAWTQTWLKILPFSYMASFPIRTFLGQVSALEWFQSIGVVAIWSFLFTLISRLIWQKGSYQYSGVGI